jgi:hypothetical protein
MKRRRGGIGVAVASGAVLRALNKEHGPKRRTRASYGLLEKTQYDQLGSSLHKSLPSRFAKYDEVDGEQYIHGIKWVIQRVCICTHK